MSSSGEINVNKKKKNRKDITFFSLFSGAGGLDYGFKEAGFVSLGASDIMKESEETFNFNWPDEPFIRKDIRQLTAVEILKKTKGKRPDILIGGPPCQGFSVMGDKNSSDPRNTLFEAYVRLVRDLKPKVFVFENVKGFKTMFEGRYMELAANSFAGLGYDVYMKVLNAADYGVPQNRERLILVGTCKNNFFEFPKPTNKKIGKIKNYKNVGEAIMDLAKPNEKIKNQLVLDHNDIVIGRYKLIKEGGKLPLPEDLPKELRRSNFGNTYVRLHRDKLSPTMVPGNNAFPVHPTLNRSLTPREAARIQTFPDDVIFMGSRRIQCILVGNAVPPLLGANIAIAIKEHLNSNSKNKIGPDILVKKNSLIENNKTIYSDNRNKSKKTSAPTFIDLFSGVGGIMLGMMNAGMKPLLSADNDHSVANTHKHNFPDIPFVEDDLSSEKAKELIKNLVKGYDLDLIVGGPPCQGFSIFGNRRFIKTQTRSYDPHKDPRNKLVYTYLDYVKMLNPKWIMIENVPGFASLDDGHFLNSITLELEKIGYKNHDYRIINTADYGVPQKRKRFIFLANRMGHIIPWPKPKYYQDPEDWQKSYRTVGEVISDLASTKSQKIYKNHEIMNHSEFLTERFSYIEEGKKMDIEKLPEKLKLGKHTGKPIKNYSHVYKRLHRNEPSNTLVPGHSAFPIHPFLNRQLTVREGARIQTFPDSLEFLGSKTEQYRQVGNAFPVKAAEHLGNFIRKAILNEWTEESLSKLAHYSLINIKEKK